MQIRAGGLAAALIAAAGVLAPAAASADVRVGALEHELGPGVEVETHAETGRVRFIGTQPGITMGAPADASPRQAALTFVSAHAGQFGAGGSQLAVERVDELSDGRSTVRLQQAVDGATVLGGQLVVNVDGANNILSVSGELSPRPRPATDPTLTATEADDSAFALVAKRYGIDAADLTASEPVLSIFDNRIVGGPGSDRPVLVWQTEVNSEDATAEPVSEFVAVDARSGAIVVHFNQVAEAMNRVVCDANNTSTRVPCTAPFVRTEGSPPSANAEANAAYTFAGDTYNFYKNRFGRDSLDGNGLQLKSTTRYCDPQQPCPFGNAFWNREQMVYGQGLVVDDVVGHELSHGVTQFTSDLFYYYQSGAINESMSDVFGEFIDLTNGAGTDTAAVRWLFGEDAAPYYAGSCTAGPELRNMANPTQCGDPDRMTSPFYWSDPSDQGGVHTNSAVNNKADYLITDGGNFNGQTISGIGIDKTARIYYEAAALLTSGSDYADLASALRQACASLVGTIGITGVDCAQVDKAVVATEMETSPPAAPATEAPVCSSGTATNFFSDDMETPAGWTVEGTTPRWAYNAEYATSGERALWSQLHETASDTSAITPQFTVPASVPSGGAFLHFQHVYGFEQDAGGSYDGGVVEYSTNNGASWTDASSLFTHNGYNGTLANGSGNPLAGRAAFTGISHGYYSSRLNLASLAGQSVKFRFRLGADQSVSGVNWTLDDVRAYTCSATTPPDTTPPETTITAGPAEGSTSTTSSESFSFISSEGGSTFECAIDGGGFAGCSSPKLLSALQNGSHTFQVRARDAANNVDATPATRTWTTQVTVPPDTTPPETTIIAGFPEGSTSTSPGAAFAFSSSENGSTFECALDGSAFATCTSPATYQGLITGPHTFQVRARDGSGNLDQTPATRHWNVQLPSAPETTITSGPAEGSVIDGDSAIFSFSSDKAAASFECALDGGGFSSCNSPHTVGPLASGQHTFRVRAVSAGLFDPSPATRGFSVVASISCAEAREALEDASAELRRAKTKLRKAKASGKKAKIRRAKRRVRTAKQHVARAKGLVEAAC